MTTIDPNLPDRFRSRVALDERGCWLWTGAKNGAGYGSFVIKTTRPVRTMLAHRYAWSVLRGTLPDLLDHLCHQRACVNPSHLRAATPKQNNENLAGPRRDNASGIRGVRKLGRGWQARVRHNGVLTELGGFATPEAAEQAAIELRAQLFGATTSGRR